MRSSRPKPLHLLCGRPMLMHVLDSLTTCGTDRVVVVVGHGADRVTSKLQDLAPALTLEFVEQHVQRGTGDAVSVGMTAIPDDDELGVDGDVLVLPGDTPLLRPETIQSLVDAHRTSGAACTLLTAEIDDPTGYGRIIRGRDDMVERVVEHSDASDEQRSIREVCTSIYCFRRSVIAPALRRLSPENAQGEYYLTDVIEVLRNAGYPVRSMIALDSTETQGVNDRLQLAAAEAVLRRRINDEWLRRGVTMLDPNQTFVDATVELGTDVTLFPGTMLQGMCVVGAGAQIGPATRLMDCIVGEDAVITFSTGVVAEIGDHAEVGPYAVLEAGTSIASGARTGPFYTGQPAL